MLPLKETVIPCDFMQVLMLVWWSPYFWCFPCVVKQATVTYYLLLDSQRSHNPDDYLDSDFEELVSSRFLVDRL